MQQMKSHCISYSTQAYLLPSALVRGSELGIYSRETHTCIRTYMAVTLRNVLHVGFQHVHGFPACGFLACGFPAYGFLACKFPRRLAIRVCFSGGNMDGGRFSTLKINGQPCIAFRACRVRAATSGAEQ